MKINIPLNNIRNNLVHQKIRNKIKAQELIIAYWFGIINNNKIILYYIK